MGSERSSEGCRMNQTLADGLAPTAMQGTSAIDGLGPSVSLGAVPSRECNAY